MSTNTDIDVAKLQVGLRHVEAQMKDLVAVQRNIADALTKLNSVHDELGEARIEIEAIRTRLNRLEAGKSVTDLANSWVFKGALALIALLVALAGTLIKVLLGV